MENKKVVSFTDLIAWQEAHKLVITIYKISKQLPKTESYILIDQMKRCVVSISSNIAEGFSRKSKKEKNQFYYTSLGSVTELQNQLLIAKDLSYMTKEVFYEVANQTIIVHKLSNGLLKSSQNYT
jgi:four helix bundle protein